MGAAFPTRQHSLSCFDGVIRCCSLSPDASSPVLPPCLYLRCLLSILVCLSSVMIPLQWVVSSLQGPAWGGVLVGPFLEGVEARLHEPRQPLCRSLVLTAAGRRETPRVSVLDGSACFLPRGYPWVVEGFLVVGYLTRCPRCFPPHSAVQKLMPLWLMVLPAY